MTGPRDWRSQADEWAQDAVAGGRPTEWFERLYAAARQGEVSMPWEHDDPHPLLAQWLTQETGRPTSGRAAVVGCGLGADAEALAAAGFATLGFDLSESAITEAVGRHPNSAVSYVVADLLDPPADWHHGFDLVVEIYTVQAVPTSMRAEMVGAVSDLVASGGTLLVVQMARAEGAQVDGPPWPLSQEEMTLFAQAGVEQISLQSAVHPVQRGVALWTGQFVRSDRP